MARLLETYNKEVFPKLQKEFGLSNPMQVPRLTKITCNIGIGEASRNAKLLDMEGVELVFAPAALEAIAVAKRGDIRVAPLQDYARRK